MSTMKSASSSSLQDGNSSSVKRHHHRHNVKSRYEFIKTLGRGTYGKVKLARHRETNKLVAVKAIKKDKIKDTVDMKHIRREMEIMSSIKHQHIIQIYEVFENQEKIVIVMEYAAGGELYDYLASKRGVTDQEAKSFFAQIVSAVQYCHNNGVVHRDLKLENILLDDSNCIKIADFGLANYFKSDSLLHTFCGSPLYASPEIVCGVPYKGPEVDSWSLGVLLYALVYGTMPFDGRNYQILTKQITSGVFNKPPKSSDAHELICWMLTVDPKNRATIYDIAGHSWVNICNEPIAPIPTLTEDTLSYVEYLSNKIDINDNVVDQLDTTLKAEDAEEVSECSQPKGILKRKSPTTAEEKTSKIQASKAAEDVLAAQLAAVCGLHAKDSLKLKVKPQSASGKRRVLRSKRERESGYYSSPERIAIAPEKTNSSEPIMHSATTDSSNMPPVKSCLANPGRLSRLNAKHCSSLPSRMSGPPKDCYLKPLAMRSEGRQASVSSDDGCSVGSQTRPASTYSDSSILSSDSFDLCTFETATTPQNISPLPPSAPTSYPTPSQRPMSLSLVPDTLPHFDDTTSEEQAPGSLTPKREKLVRDLERILAPTGRRNTKRNPRLGELDQTKRPHSYDEPTELSVMMKKLNMDLDIAYKKACYDISASAEV